MNKDKKYDWSSVFEISNNDYDDVQLSMTMRLQELECLTLLLAQQDKELPAINPREMSYVFWHIHHAVEDLACIFNRFSEITMQKSG